MANTPLEFLLKGWDGHLELIFVANGDRATTHSRTRPGDRLRGRVRHQRAAARALTARLARWPRPVLNGAPGVMRLGRDRAPMRLEAAPASTCRRAAHQPSAAGGAELGAAPLGGYCPTRRCRPRLSADRPAGRLPRGRRAGKAGSCAAIAGYLERCDAELFYLSPFVDYAGPDGRFRKLRVAMIEGQPFIAHMAISDHWMVHYLNAGMAEDAAKRAEEAR